MTSIILNLRHKRLIPNILLPYTQHNLMFSSQLLQLIRHFFRRHIKRLRILKPTPFRPSSPTRIQIRTNRTRSYTNPYIRLRNTVKLSTYSPHLLNPLYCLL
ncbi:hypothetical protein Hanom_Chr06g00489901 [Helianthus anomalus]